MIKLIALVMYQRFIHKVRQKKTLELAKKIVEIEWISKRGSKVLSVNGDSSNPNDYFKLGCKYSGIPYASEWRRVNWFGWHISLHTFLNAANDSRSSFYEEAGRSDGPGYGLVCSTFATLVSGWDYPIVSRAICLDPQCFHYITK
jgi:hypothetical protein